MQCLQEQNDDNNMKNTNTRYNGHRTSNTQRKGMMTKANGKIKQHWDHPKSSQKSTIYLEPQWPLSFEGKIPQNTGHWSYLRLPGACKNVIYSIYIYTYILLMDKILHHLGCIKPCQKPYIYHINWWTPDFWTIYPVFKYINPNKTYQSNKSTT